MALAFRSGCHSPRRMGCVFFFGKVAIYEVSDAARLEANQAAHPVGAPSSGRVISSDLVLGRNVKAGDVLVELDSSQERLQLAEYQTRLPTIAPALRALKRQISAESKARDQDRQASLEALDEGRARHRGAEAAAKFAQENMERLRELYGAGLTPLVSVHQAEAEAEECRAATESVGFGLSRLDAVTALLESAAAETGWRALGALEAATRALDVMVCSKGIRRFR
jgi:multidrug resistance efflux pump